MVIIQLNIYNKNDPNINKIYEADLVLPITYFHIHIFILLFEFICE